MQSTATTWRAPVAAILALAAAVALAVALAPTAGAQDGESAWPTYTADAGHSRASSAEGPSDPGVNWLRDIGEPQAGDQVDAPEGYSPAWGRRGQGMPVVAPGGVLAMRANNQEGDRVVIGIDADSGDILWESAEAYTRFRGCEPGVDSQGRVWVEDYSGDDHAVVALDAATGDERVRIDERLDGSDVPTCGKFQMLIGGDGEAERLVLLGDQEDPDDIVAIDTSGDDADVAIAWEADGDAVGFDEVLGGPRGGTGASYRFDLVAMSDAGLFLGALSEDGEDVTVEIVEFELDGDGSVANRVEIAEPTPDPAEDEEPVDLDDYQRLRMLVADDTLVVGPTGASINHLVAYDVSDGLPASHDWLERIDGGPRAMSAYGGVLITQPGGSGDLQAFSLADGSLAWEGETGTGAEGGTIPVDASGNMYVRTNLSGTTRARDIASLDATGQARWWFHESAVAEALGVDDVDDLSYGHANLLLGPIDDNGTLYAASRSANRDGLLAIDSSGDIPTEFVGAPDDDDRVAGSDRIETSVELSREFSEADTVVLARSDEYPDALAGAPLATALEAPILLTPPTSLDPAVAAEIDRLGASEAVLLGGDAALSQSVESALLAEGLTTERYAGSNRFDTAAQIAEDVPNPGDMAFVVQGQDPDPNRGWPDAVAVSALAAFTETPILLTMTDTLPDDTRDAVIGLQGAEIVGGTAVVSANVENDLEGILGALAVDRTAGVNRYDTSAQLAHAADELGMDPSTTWLATGGNWPDSLSAAPVVGSTAPTVAEGGGILLLIDGDDLDASAESRDWIADNAASIDRIRPVGGTAVISSDVVDQAREAAGVQ